MNEATVLQKYSTPGLRKNVLERTGKKWHLWGKGIRGAEAEKILDELYPETATKEIVK